jgi:hypothetical protein
VSELFNENLLDLNRSSVVYDEAGFVIKLSLFDGSSDGASLLIFPADFHQLTHLRELYLYVPCFSLPTSLCQLPNLRSFVLSSPFPVEGFPPEFAQLKTLQYLGLGELEWREVPPVIWQLPNLRALDLSGNQLTYLPPEIGQLTSLHFLYLLDNRLLQLPVEIGQLEQLEEFELWPHNLQTLPEEITRLHHLYEMELSRNLLESLDIPRIAARMGMVFSPHPLFPALRRMLPATVDMPPYPCACCGYLTRKANEQEHEICPVCFWEADAQQRLSPSSAMGANQVCLIEARLNFARIGASEDRALTRVRPAQPEEMPDELTRVPYLDFGRFLLSER